MTGRDHPTWEYRIAPDLSETDLNRLGEEGWELVAVGADGTSPVFYLKRARPDFREQVTLDQKARYVGAGGAANPGGNGGR
jgi:hypothetical protein